MTRASTRFAWPLIGLFAVLALLVGWQEMRPRLSDPCARPFELTATGAIPGSVPGRDRNDHGDEAVVQWSRGTVAHPLSDQPPLEFQIIRSYDGRPFYERAVWVAPQKVQPEQHDVVEVDTPDGPVPIHLVYDLTKSPGVLVGYVFVQGLAATQNPFLYQIRRAWSQLVQGRPPLTLLLVSGTAPQRAREAVEERMRTWLLDAVARFDAVCRTDGAP